MSSRKRRLYETTDGVYCWHILEELFHLRMWSVVQCGCSGSFILIDIKIIGRIPPHQLWINVSYADIG